MIYTLLVCLIAALEFAGVVWILLRSALDVHRKMVFIAAAVGSMAAKLALATCGHNYDIESYGIVAGIVGAGKNVYASTSRYNYAPLWACFLSGLKHISSWLPFAGPEKFHLAIAGFLAITDIAIAALLLAAYSYGAGLFFLCSPVVILLTGFHSQFDNLALLFGLASWVLIRRGSAGRGGIAAASALMGISLAIKHALFLFPLWILLWPRPRGIRWRLRLIFAAVAYGLFAISFIPWADDAPARAGIVQNVFLYRSESHFSAMHMAVAGHVLGPASPGESAPLW